MLGCKENSVESMHTDVRVYREQCGEFAYVPKVKRRRGFPFLIRRTKRLQLQYLSNSKSTADFVYNIMKSVSLSNAVIYNSVT